MKYRDSSGVLHEFELIKGKSAYDSAKMGGLPSSVTETEFYNKLANSLTEDELDEKLDEYATKEYADDKADTKQDLLVSGTNIKTINGTSILGSGNIVVEGGSGGTTDLSDYYTKEEVDDLVDEKQETLVSGDNIKTINGTSILGSGDITIEGGDGSSIDDTSVETDKTWSSQKIFNQLLSVSSGSNPMLDEVLIAKYDTEIIGGEPVVGYAIRNTGVVSHASYSYKDYPVTEGDKIYMNWTWRSYCGYELKDSSDTNVDVFYTTDMNKPSDDKLKITIPENVVKLRLYYKNTDDINDLWVCKLSGYDIKENSSALFGKKWSIYGDSFTEGSYTDYVDKDGKTLKASDCYDRKNHCWVTYGSIIGTRNHMNWTNYGFSGSCLTNIQGKKCFSDLTRTDGYTYENIPTDSDYITLAFGLNDQATATIGTKEDTTNETMWGAYNLTFEWILTNCPQAKVGVIIEDGWYLEEFRVAMIEICKYWGIPYLDLSASPEVTRMINRSNPSNAMGTNEKYSDVARNLRHEVMCVSSTNFHPSPFAHKFRSTIIESWLKTL